MATNSRMHVVILMLLNLNLAARLSFFTPRAESVTAMHLSFSPTFSLEPGETISLLLPNDIAGEHCFILYVV